MKGASLLVLRDTGLLCVTVLWWKSSDRKRAQHLLWRPDQGAKQDAIQARRSQKKKIVLEQFGQEDNRILYFLAQE